MDVKNKVDEDVVENVVKEDTSIKPDADATEPTHEAKALQLASDFGELVGYYKGMSDSKKVAHKAVMKAGITGMLAGSGAFAIGYIVGRSFAAILFNKHHN